MRDNRINGGRIDSHVGQTSRRSFASIFRVDLCVIRAQMCQHRNFLEIAVCCLFELNKWPVQDPVVVCDDHLRG
jgi:hypothetical protein